MKKLSDFDIFDIGNKYQLVGAVYADNEQALLCLLPGEENNRPIEELRMDGEDWKKFLRQTDLLEYEMVQKSPDGSIVKAILRKTAHHVEQGIAWNVYRRDKFVCRYCGKALPLTMDHLVLLELGGPDIEANLVAACRKCNKIRGNMLYGEWLEHAYYLEVSKGLTPEQRQANRDLLGTLDSIPRKANVKSR